MYVEGYLVGIRVVLLQIRGWSERKGGGEAVNQDDRSKDRVIS